MNIHVSSGREEFELRIPDDAEIYVSTYPAPSLPAADLVLDAVRAPLGVAPLRAVELATSLAVRSVRLGPIWGWPALRPNPRDALCINPQAGGRWS